MRNFSLKCFFEGDEPEGDELEGDEPERFEGDEPEREGFPRNANYAKEAKAR